MLVFTIINIITTKMNSLRTLQALNQVVNHDICPQMKALIAENKRLVAKNNRCLKKIKSAKSGLKMVIEMNKQMTAENNELFEWKDYMLHMDYFRCIDCKAICSEGSGDDRDEYNVSIRCEDCEYLREDQAAAIIHHATDPGLEIIANEPDLDMETDPRFEYDEEEDGYIYTGNV